MSIADTYCKCTINSIVVNGMTTLITVVIDGGEFVLDHHNSYAKLLINNDHIECSIEHIEANILQLQSIITAKGMAIDYHYYDICLMVDSSNIDKISKLDLTNVHNNVAYITFDMNADKLMERLYKQLLEL